MALHTALQYPKLLGGVIGISGYLFQFTELKNAENLIVKLTHGELDTMIPGEYAEISYERLEKKCKNFEFYV